jgi:long-chain acyl-CoA synthetase
VNLADLVAQAASQHGRRPAVTEVDGAGRASWSQVEAAVARAAAGLRRRGVGVGERVGLLLPNSLGFATAYWAALRAGATAVLMNPGYTPRELAHMLDDTGAVAVVTDRRLVGQASAATRASGAAMVLVEALEEAGGPPVEAGGEAAEVAVIAYTAGTTGRPMGAELTHGNLLANLASFGELPRLAITRQDVLYGVLPFFHIFGLNVVLNASARAGAEVVAVERFNPTTSLAVLRAHGVTVAYGAPQMFAAWCTAPRSGGPLPRLRAAVSGGDSLPVRTFTAFAERYGVPIHEGYGLTETSPVLTSVAASPEIRAGTVGHALPRVEVRVVAPGGEDCPRGEVGEIVARGPNVFRGYHRRPEATAEAFVDGWFRTGDLGAFDADGYLAIRGRLKDMLIVSGFNVYPREVEEVLLAHPAVAEAAVIGIPDRRTGERVHAVVVPRRGVRLDVDELLDHCRERLARYKLPREVELVATLPRSALGKLLRADLRAETRG